MDSTHVTINNTINSIINNTIANLTLKRLDGDDASFNDCDTVLNVEVVATNPDNRIT